ncbi:fibrillin-2-like isoform X1 [Aphidius gifuensis]|nr:fibrillin-2-like isoform X1 [Aphidius gifuensis]
MKSVCSGTFCKCYTNYKDLKDCTLKPSHFREFKNDGIIGRICHHDIDCNLHNRHCNTTTHQCACDRGYVASKNSKTCLPVAKSMDEFCEDDKQCLATMPNTTCQEHKCTCINGFNYNKNICYKQIGINEHCTANEECSHVPRAICNDNQTCSCSSDDILSFDKTRCISTSLDSQDACLASVECKASFGDAECVDKSCKCIQNNHYAADIKRCVLNRAIDESCEFDYECYQENAANEIGSLKCLSNKCICSDDSTRDGNICIGNGATTINQSILFGGLLTAILTIIMSY